MKVRWCFFDYASTPARGDRWHKAKDHESAYRAALELVRVRYPLAHSRGYVRRIVCVNGKTEYDFGHHSVFLAIKETGGRT